MKTFVQYYHYSAVNSEELVPACGSDAVLDVPSNLRALIINRLAHINAKKLKPVRSFDAFAVWQGGSYSTAKPISPVTLLKGV